MLEELLFEMMQVDFIAEWRIVEQKGFTLAIIAKNLITLLIANLASIKILFLLNTPSKEVKWKDMKALNNM